MPVGISNLAHSIRKSSSAEAVPIPLGHAHQLVAAAMGYMTLASYQAAQAAGAEPSVLDQVGHVVPNYDLLDDRARELGIGIPASRLQEILKLAFSDRLPRARLHGSYGGVEDAIRDLVDQAALNYGDVANAMANANYDGIDEVYFEYEVEPDTLPVGEPLVIKLEGHVGLGIDLERPFAGNKVNVEGTLTVDRLGRCCFALPEVEVSRAALDYNWSDSGEGDEGTPMRRRTEAFAELLGLQPDEVGGLVDVEPQPLDGHSGEMIYGYLLDFEGFASPEIAARILARHGSLRVEVGPAFFDTVLDDDWPN
jgi:hypothetical protein